MNLIKLFDCGDQIRQEHELLDGVAVDFCNDELAHRQPEDLAAALQALDHLRLKSFRGKFKFVRFFFSLKLFANAMKVLHNCIYLFSKSFVHFLKDGPFPPSFSLFSYFLFLMVQLVGKILLMS